MSKMKTTLCVGITDEVFDKNGEKLLGYVGFHEYDGYIPIKELRNKLYNLAKRLRTQIFCLKTGYGYHFVSLEIFTKEERIRWALELRREFPSDYKQFSKDKRHHRVLRTSKKGKAMKPKLLSCYTLLVNPKRKLSSAHIEVYVGEGMIPWFLFDDRRENIVETTCVVGGYIAGIKELKGIPKGNSRQLEKE